MFGFFAVRAYITRPKDASELAASSNFFIYSSETIRSAGRTLARDSDGYYIVRRNGSGDAIYLIVPRESSRTIFVITDDEPVRRLEFPGDGAILNDDLELVASVNNDELTVTFRDGSTRHLKYGSDSWESWCQPPRGFGVDPGGEYFFIELKGSEITQVCRVDSPLVPAFETKLSVKRLFKNDRRMFVFGDRRPADWNGALTCEIYQVLDDSVEFSHEINVENLLGYNDGVSIYDMDSQSQTVAIYNNVDLPMGLITKSKTVFVDLESSAVYKQDGWPFHGLFLSSDLVREAISDGAYRSATP